MNRILYSQEKTDHLNWHIIEAITSSSAKNLLSRAIKIVTIKNFAFMNNANGMLNRIILIIIGLMFFICSCGHLRAF